MVVVAKKSGCDVRLCCQQQRSKSLLQGDSVVKVTKSFPEFPSSNYSTTGRVELEVEIAAFCCEFRAIFARCCHHQFCWFGPRFSRVVPACSSS